MGVMASLLPMDLGGLQGAPEGWLVGWLVECSEVGKHVVFMFGLGRAWCVDGVDGVLCIVVCFFWRGGVMG